MPQAIEVETQSEQQGLAHLHPERAAGRPSRELALHRREHRFDQGAAPVELSRKRPPHFGPHSAHPPGLLPTLGRDHAPGPQWAPEVGMIPLAIEFGVGQHHSDARLLGSRFAQARQIRAVVPRTASRALPEQELLIQIRHDHPLQPVPPGQGFLPVMMQAPHKKRADRSWRQAGRVDGHPSPPVAPASPSAHPAHRLADSPIDALVFETPQETVQRREVGHTRQSQGLTQFAVLAQPHLGFAKGPVLVTHQTEDGQQLRLGELVLAEASSIGWEHRPTHFPSGAGKGQESNLRHRAGCLLPSGPFPRAGALEFSVVEIRMSTEPLYFYATTIGLPLSRVKLQSPWCQSSLEMSPLKLSAFCFPCGGTHGFRPALRPKRFALRASQGSAPTGTRKRPQHPKQPSENFRGDTSKELRKGDISKEL